MHARDEGGQTRPVTEVHADTVEFLDGRCYNAGAAGSEALTNDGLWYIVIGDRMCVECVATYASPTHRRAEQYVFPGFELYLERLVAHAAFSGTVLVAHDTMPHF